MASLDASVKFAAADAAIADRLMKEMEKMAADARGTSAQDWVDAAATELAEATVAMADAEYGMQNINSNAEWEVANEALHFATMRLADATASQADAATELAEAQTGVTAADADLTTAMTAADTAATDAGFDPTAEDFDYSSWDSSAAPEEYDANAPAEGEAPPAPPANWGDKPAFNWVSYTELIKTYKWSEIRLHNDHN